MLEGIADLFTACFKGNGILHEWKLQNLTRVFKKGGKLDCRNYTEVSVLQVQYILYGQVIKQHTEGQIQELEKQSGLRPGCSCVNNVFCIKQFIEKTLANNRELHIVFIDFKKAYNSVPIKYLWTVMKDFGVK